MSVPLARARQVHLYPGRNRWERLYAQELDLRKRAGAIADWRYEGVRLRMADGAWYKPDFLVILTDGLIELHEVKGHWREAARVRIKVTAELYPWFRFLVVRNERGNFVFDEVYEGGT